MTRTIRDETKKSEDRTKRLELLDVSADDFLSILPPQKIIIDYVKTDDEPYGKEYKRWITYKDHNGNKVRALRKYSGIVDEVTDLTASLRGLPKDDEYISRKYIKEKVIQVDGNKEYVRTAIEGKTLLPVEVNKKKARRVLFKHQILKTLLRNTSSEVAEFVVTLSDFNQEKYQDRTRELKYAPAAKEINRENQSAPHAISSVEIMYNLLLDNDDFNKENVIFKDDGVIWLDVELPYNVSIKERKSFKDLIYDLNFNVCASENIESLTINEFLNIRKNFPDIESLRKQAVIDGNFEDAVLFMARIAEMFLLMKFLETKRGVGETLLNNFVSEPSFAKEFLEFIFISRQPGYETEEPQGKISNKILDTIYQSELKKCQKTAEEINIKKAELITLADQLKQSEETKEVQIGIIKGFKTKVKNQDYFLATNKEGNIYNLFYIDENNECERIIDHEITITDFREGLKEIKKDNPETKPRVSLTGKLEIEERII